MLLTATNPANCGSADQGTVSGERKGGVEMGENHVLDGDVHRRQLANAVDRSTTGDAAIVFTV